MSPAAPLWSWATASLKNFNNPYHAKTIAEFWRRWHISLSTWFRDYLYIPLGGNRCSRERVFFNILVVFVISGLWHGASWAFIIWGALHGFYLIFGLATHSARDRARQKLGIGANTFIRNAVGVIVTFHLTLLAWIFFRSSALAHAIEDFHRPFQNRPRWPVPRNQR